jgi:hypothetical protein
MNPKHDPDLPVSDLSYRAAGLFARLTNALDRNDFAEAATSVDDLRRLGYVVHIQIPTALTTAQGPPTEADGQGVAL